MLHIIFVYVSSIRKTIIRSGTDIIVCVLCLICASCSGFVQDIRRPIDLITDDALNTESQADFLIRGVQAQFSESYSDAALYAGGLSDELFFDSRTGAGGLVVYEEVDNALTIDRSNTTLITVQNRLGRYRFHADDLAQRAGKISFTLDSSRRRMAFQGYFHGAVARYFYAAYVGINKQQGGGVIDNGAFIPSSAMNDSALAKLTLASQNTTSSYEARLTNTLAARIHLMEGRFAAAQQAAQNGLRKGDASFQALFNLVSSNQLWLNAGLGRNVYLPARRFDTLYLRQDPLDSVRIKLRGPTTRPGFTFYVQTKYAAQDSPMPFLTWQENELMLAECELRLADNAASALARINTVRTSYTGLRALPAGTTATLDLIYTERDKELFLTGMRIIDQRRFNRWHLRSDTWRYMPIVQPEINNNPNLPPLVRD
jgi:hypothetical protein